MTCFTLQGTDISPKNGILKMIFLFPRWDMLIPWRVILSILFYLQHMTHSWHHNWPPRLSFACPTGITGRHISSLRPGSGQGFADVLHPLINAALTLDTHFRGCRGHKHPILQSTPRMWIHNIVHQMSLSYILYIFSLDILVQLLHNRKVSTSHWSCVSILPGLQRLGSSFSMRWANLSPKAGHGSNSNAALGATSWVRDGPTNGTNWSKAKTQQKIKKWYNSSSPGSRRQAAPFSWKQLSLECMNIHACKTCNTSFNKFILIELDFQGIFC